MLLRNDLQNLINNTMGRVLLSLFLIVITFQDNLLLAENETIRFDDYSYKDGLTTSCVYSAYKDSRGFLWLCTINGLYRYDGYNFRNINTLLKGVPNCEIQCVIEDKDQNLWIGTSGKGILIYNFYKEKIIHLNIKPENSFKISQIHLFGEKVYLATNAGLLIVKKQKDYKDNDTLKTRVLLPDPEHKNSQINNITFLYHQLNRKSLWIGTNGSLFELDTNNVTFKQIPTDPQNSIRWISEYKNKLIVGSWDGGIFSINPLTSKVENDHFINSINSIVNNKRVMTVIADNKKRLWLATYGSGLYVFKENLNGSVIYENYRNVENQTDNLKSDIINQLYIDNSGITWLCMNQPALTKIYYQKNNLHLNTISEKGNEIGVKEIITVMPSIDKNKLWIATNGMGIFLYDCRNKSYTNFTKKPSSLIQLDENDVSYCYQDKDGNLWIIYRRLGLFVVPARNALNLLNGNLNTKIKPIDANPMLSPDSKINSYITRIYEDNSGRIWFGGWGSLSIVNLSKDFSNIKSTEDILLNSKASLIYITDKQDEIKYPISPVLSIIERPKNKYWLGTMDAGIIELAENPDHSFSGNQLEISKKLPSLNVKIIHADHKKGFWIGTNSGLCYWDGKSDQVRTFTLNEGLSSMNINNLIEDDKSNIWISTSYGVSIINKNDYSVQNYFIDHNEKYNQYIPNAVAQTTDGDIYFSSNDVLVSINPDSVELNATNPPLYFTDIKINNQTVNTGEKYHGTMVINSNINDCKKINVPYNYTLNIEFAALDYVSADRIMYKYKIGNNKEWITLNSNQRSLILPSLRPGEYQLSIMKAGSNDNTVRTLILNYLPPFWRSKPAFVIYIIFLLTLFLTYRKLIITRVTQQSVIEKERYERKKLEELDKMKSEFFTNISHEFRTPLSLIINPLENLAKNGQLSEKSKDKLKLVLKSSNRLLKLTNELMDFGKIEKKLLKPEFQLCEINSLVRNSCQLFNNLADTMNIDFKLNTHIEQAEIPIDSGMIEKVIFNLLSNAFKYTQKNGIILVELSKIRDNDNEFIKISVINTGEGIPQEDLSRIFDRYYQVSNIQNRNIEGTGIGLALVKNFIELHNGKVDVHSKPHVETSFDIYLPFHQAGFELQNAEAKTSSLLVSKELITPLTSQSAFKPAFHYQLLLIEDDVDIRNYIVNELSSEFKIATANDGTTGLQIANEIIPDLIITDIIMPGISGTELCATLKKQVTTSHIPIIILSAKATTEQQIEGLEMGADVYMVKPFSLEFLKTQIIRLLHLKETIYARFLKENAIIPQGALTNKIDEEFIQKVLKFIEENLSNTDLSVDQLADHIALSKVQVYRKIKAISGQSVVEFIRTIRLKKAAELVLEKKYSFFEIAYETGFSTPSYFTKCFHDHFGKTPTEFATDYGNKPV